ncbi:MAG: calcium/sodium antiporter [Gemmiger sp.]
MPGVILLFLLGLGLLIKGGDWFVDGATALARRFRLPEILIGSTIVSIGTTLPEVMVSTTSALSGHGEMAYGNTIGSVICNTALIAALSAAVRPGPADGRSLRLPAALFTAAAVAFGAVAYTTGQFSRAVGLGLLGLFLVYLILSVHKMRTAPAPEAAPAEPPAPLWRTLLGLVAGAAAIAWGADLLVDNGTRLAEALGVPEAVIALTFVALGTSLPELVTAVTALAKGHSALSLGNVIGANLLNLVLVTGTAATLAPFPLPQDGTLFGVNRSLALDLPVMAVVSLVLILPVLLRGRLYRAQGILLLAVYGAFCVGQFLL